MPHIHVCPLSRLDETVAASGASHLVTLVNKGTDMRRPLSIPFERHLFLGLNDVTGPADGMTPPQAGHIRQLIEFAGDWDRLRPIVIHCYAGISRSTAAAFVLACALEPRRAEAEIARELRRASPMATPNRLIVALGDEVLARDGRMIAAIESIGRGADAFENEPFVLELTA
jgi:predicted protein tyrosine phosphatase